MTFRKFVVQFKCESYILYSIIIQDVAKEMCYNAVIFSNALKSSHNPEKVLCFWSFSMLSSPN